MKIASFARVTFRYNTGSIPPPFCFRYSISITSLENEHFPIQINLEYFDRDEITEDEILAEGFTSNDDFQWTGNLPKIWGEEIVRQINTSNWKKKAKLKSNEEGLTIKIEQGNIAEALEPANTRSWEVFIQEIIQACFELSEKEAPLYISFANKKSAKTHDEVSITYSFAEKNIHIHSKAEVAKTMNWVDGRKLLKYIFGIDYLPENGFEKIPDKVGRYISPGDELWYFLDSGEKVGQKPSKESQLSTLLLQYLT